MKTSNIIPLLSAALLTGAQLLLAGCEKEENIEKEKDTTASVLFKDISKELSFCDISCDTIVLVNDNKHLKTICENAPAIDFSKQSLLLVSGISTYGIDTIITGFNSRKNSIYTLDINIIQYFTLMAQGWQQKYLVPKTNTLENISVNICYSNSNK